MSISDPIPCCKPVFAARLGRTDADEVARAFRALADPARIRLLSLIAAQPDAEACVCHLLKPIGLSQPTVSHHLKLLHEAGLLDRERRGSWVYYRIVPQRLAALRDALALPDSVERPHGKRRERAARA
jgi:ArsR family transcriptional regulator, arsenate/arsenite/antimonite-responsive transcriptional repressor